MSPMNLKNILEKLKDPSEDVRISGCVELSESGHPKSRQALARISTDDRSPRVRYAARKLLDVWDRKLHTEPDLFTSPAVESETAPGPGFELEGQLAALAGDLTSLQQDVRLQAAMKICNLQDRHMLKYVLAALDRESDPVVLASLVKALGACGDSSHVKRLAEFLRDENHRVRANAVEALLMLQSSLSLALVFPLLQDTDHRVRAVASQALSVRGEDHALKVLQRMSETNEIWMRDSAAFALGELDIPEAIPLLLNLHTDRNASVRMKAERGLKKFAELGYEEAAHFIDGLPHEEEEPATVVEVMTVVEDKRATLADLDDSNPKLRMNIVNEIISNKDREGLSSLVEHLAHEENVFVASRILSAIGLLGEGDADRYRSVLAEYLKHPDLRTVANAIEAATRLEDPVLRSHIRPLKRSPNARIRGNALVYLHDDPAVDVSKELSDMAMSHNSSLQNAAIYTVERLADRYRELVPQLVLLAETKDPEVFYYLGETLQRLNARGVSEAAELIESLRGAELDSGGSRSLANLAKAPYLKRVYALVYDSLGFLGVCFCLGMVVGTVTMGSKGATVESLRQLVALVATILFFIKDGYRGGRGLGKEKVGLRVIDIHTGEGCSYFRSLLRQATLLLPGLNLIEIILPAVDKHGHRLIDKLLDTQVIEDTHQELTTIQKAVAYTGAAIIGFVLLLVIFEYISKKLGG